LERTLAELAEMVGGTVEGDGSVRIAGVSGIKEARKGDLTFVSNPKYASLVRETKASAAIVGRDLEIDADIPLIRAASPDMAFVKVVETFSPEPLSFYKGIHPTAVIGEDVVVGKDVSIQAYAVIQDGAEVGDRTIIHPGSVVGHFTKIGCDCIIYPRVVIRERITIGDRVIIHGGAIIGSDGFGFATVEGVHHKIPQIGTVVIEDDVEIGANTCVDRARFDRTIIKRGTKIDNLVQIAHNVVIGENSFVVALTGIAGSARIGRNVILAAQTGVIGHIEVGDNVRAASRSGITKDVPAGAAISGFPAQPHSKETKMQAHLRKLPELAARLKELSERVAELEEQLSVIQKGGAL